MSHKPSTFQTPITELLQMFGLVINPGKEFFGPNSMVVEEGLCDCSRWLSLLNMYRYFSFETRVVRKLLNALDLPIILWFFVKFVWLYEHFECVWISILLKCISYGTTQYEVENGICDVLRSCFLLTEVMTGARLGRSIVLQSVLERKEAGSTPDINQNTYIDRQFVKSGEYTRAKNY